MKWNLNLPYMTKAEGAAFKKARIKGEITSFRVAICQGIKNMDNPDKAAESCTAEVPKVEDEHGAQVKRYCSLECYTAMEGPADEPEQEDEE